MDILSLLTNFNVGASVGKRLGERVGVMVGYGLVGTNVGPLVGVLLGEYVGALLGLSDGPTVGDRVGDGVAAHCEMPGHPSRFTHPSPVEMNYEKNIVLENNKMQDREQTQSDVKTYLQWDRH